MVDKNSDKIKSMFDEISPQYDFLNNLISFFTHKYIKKIFTDMADLDFNSKVLDVCTGTGDIAGLFSQKKEVKSTRGIDISEKMINIAKSKYPEIEFCIGDCTSLDFQDEEFDCVSISFGLRNIEKTNLALREINRVLKNKGIFLYLDFKGGKTFLDIFYCAFIRFIAFIFAKNKNAYKYLIESKYSYYKRNELTKKIQNMGFKLKKEKILPFILIQKYEKISYKVDLEH